MAELQGSPWDQAVAVTAVAVSKQGPPGAGGVQELGPRAAGLAAGRLVVPTSGAAERAVHLATCPVTLITLDPSIILFNILT